MARWLKSEVEGGPFAGQPAPGEDDVPMPDNFDPAQHDGAFERKFFEQDRVQPLATPPVVEDDPLALEDGEVALIEPLDPADRFVTR